MIRRSTVLITTLIAVFVACVFSFSNWKSNNEEYRPTGNLTSSNISIIKTLPATTINTTGTDPVTVIPSTAATQTIGENTKYIGSLDAPVKIVVYSDYQCSACQQFALTVEKQLISAYVVTGKVLLIYKNLIGFGEESRFAAEAAEAAAAQGKFWEFHDMLMQLRPTLQVEGDLSKGVFLEVATTIGLEIDRFREDLVSGKYLANVDQENQEAAELDVHAIPTFFINGIRQEGAKDLDVLGNIIDGLIGTTSNE